MGHSPAAAFSCSMRRIVARVVRGEAEGEWRCCNERRLRLVRDTGVEQKSMSMFPRAHSKIVTSDSGVLREIPVNVTQIGANVKGLGYMLADSE